MIRSTNVDHHDYSHWRIEPVRDRKIADDFNLAHAQRAVLVREIAGCFRSLAEAANEIHDPVALIPALGYGIQQADMHVDLVWPHEALRLVKTPFEIVGSQPMGRVAVRQAGIHLLLVIAIRFMPQVEKESRNFALLGGGQSGNRLLDFFHTHWDELTRFEG
ncbi:MAG TPA: hypothetical protein VGM54_17120 [Chthoniobacter sp.]